MCNEPPGTSGGGKTQNWSLTDDGGGLDGVHHLLQGFDVRMVVGKLLLLVVQVAPPLQRVQSTSFSNVCVTKEDRLNSNKEQV